MVSAHAEREPSRTASPAAGSVTWPRVDRHAVAFSSVTLGTEPMSAYRVLPFESAAIVFTHGIPWYFLRIFSSLFVDFARSVSKK